MLAAQCSFRVYQRVEINVAAINAAPRWIPGHVHRVWPDGERFNVITRDGHLFAAAHWSSLRAVVLEAEVA
jgi:hypothetical protein